MRPPKWFSFPMVLPLETIHWCAFHNLHLAQSDVGKRLTYSIRDLNVIVPDKQSVSDVLTIQLYRSLVGPCLLAITWTSGPSPT